MIYVEDWPAKHHFWWGKVSAPNIISRRVCIICGLVADLLGGSLKLSSISQVSSWMGDHHNLLPRSAFCQIWLAPESGMIQRMVFLAQGQLSDCQTVCTWASSDGWVVTVLWVFWKMKPHDLSTPHIVGLTVILVFRRCFLQLHSCGTPIIYPAE